MSTSISLFLGSLLLLNSIYDYMSEPFTERLHLLQDDFK